ncbi:MAG: cold-shock protein [Planctomycetes bacterium]|jgi:CspA family cold shock protein|nr:cold-shock protein [Planctomycetota bacterium]MDP6425079.1 cold shock domain-containing protein [Planctomycetota bacterium]
MAKGTIKKLVSDKGFGFIEGDGVELFFHSSALQNCRFDELREGQAVEYTAGDGPKGPRAESVEIV